MTWTIVERTNFNLEFVSSFPDIESFISWASPRHYPGRNEAYKRKCLVEVWARAKKPVTKVQQEKPAKTKVRNGKRKNNT